MGGLEQESWRTILIAKTCGIDLVALQREGIIDSDQFREIVDAMVTCHDYVRCNDMPMTEMTHTSGDAIPRQCRNRAVLSAYGLIAANPV